MELTDENARLNNHGHRHTLMIPSVTEEDLGNYTCRAENKHGLTSRELEVSGKTCLVHLERNLPRMMVDLSKYLTLTYKLVFCLIYSMCFNMFICFTVVAIPLWYY